MAGTALVMASLSVAATLPYAALQHQLARTARAFRGRHDCAGRSFLQLHSLFTAMLHPISLPQEDRWRAPLSLPPCPLFSPALSAALPALPPCRCAAAGCVAAVPRSGSRARAACLQPMRPAAVDRRSHECW